MQVTTGAGIEVIYFIPVNFLLLVASMFSTAALVQLHTQARRAMVASFVRAAET